MVLNALEIHDLPLVDRLEISFQPGLNVLTGETGAGKSILLGALGFALGWRGRAAMVRDGASRGEVTAVFHLAPGHPAWNVLAEAGLSVQDELILRRVCIRDGRNTSYVNDRRVSGEVLRALSECLVEIHGQHDDRGLLNPRRHLDMLDAFADAEAQREETRSYWRELIVAEREIADARSGLEAERVEEEYLRYAVDELGFLDPQPGEERELDQQRRLMRAAERIRADVGKAYEALGTNGAEGMIADAIRWLESVTDQAEGRLDEPVAALSRALTELGEAEQGVRNVMEELSQAPTELERVEERLFGIRAAARKHGVPPDSLGEHAVEIRDRLAAIDGSADRLDALVRRKSDVQARYDGAAQALSQRRLEAAAVLDRAMKDELTPLKLDGARFHTGITPTKPGPQGWDAVAFSVSPNPGAAPGPIQSIASGGELSRFLLALKVCLTRRATDLTMIFDEIDRGVGGATADAIGRRLSALAGSAQILVVTHSPQIAARARHHWLVAKRMEDSVTFSAVSRIDGADRVDELARMLAGSRITGEAREAAKALLAD